MDLFLGESSTMGELYLHAPTLEHKNGVTFWVYGLIGDREQPYTRAKSLLQGIGTVTAFKDYFDAGSIFTERAHIWAFAELMSAYYTFRDMCEMYKMGRTMYASSGLCEEFLLNPTEAALINDFTMPALFDKTTQLLNALQSEETYDEALGILAVVNPPDLAVRLKLVAVKFNTSLVTVSRDYKNLNCDPRHTG